MISRNLTKLGSQGRVPASGAVGDVIEPRSVGVGVVIPDILLVHR